MSARRPGAMMAQLGPAELQCVVVGGGGEGFARREAEAHQHFQFRVFEMPGNGAEDGRAGCGEVVRGAS